MDSIKEARIKVKSKELSELKNLKESLTAKLLSVTENIKLVKNELFLDKHEIYIGQDIKITDNKKTTTGILKSVENGVLELEQKTGKIKKIQISGIKTKITYN